jgi:mono/diheme cytochrome c family protein
MKPSDLGLCRALPSGACRVDRRRRAGRGWWVGALSALTLVSTGCDVWYNRVPSPDDLWHVVPWFDHMIQAKYIHPYETAAVPRYTPPGTVPVTGGEPDWSAEWTTGKTTTADGLRNPYAPAAGSPASGGSSAGDSAKASPPGPAIPVIPRGAEAAGDSMFQNYCAVCHGAAGDAKGPVSSRMGAPSLLTGRARAYSDGYLYSIIRYGRGVMPRYGDKVYLPGDRWAIVNHIRKLQGQTPLAPEPAGAAAGIAPSPSATGSTGERPR